MRIRLTSPSGDNGLIKFTLSGALAVMVSDLIAFTVPGLTSNSSTIFRTALR